MATPVNFNGQNYIIPNQSMCYTMQHPQGTCSCDAIHQQHISNHLAAQQSMLSGLQNAAAQQAQYQQAAQMANTYGSSLWGQMAWGGTAPYKTHEEMMKEETRLRGFQVIAAFKLLEGFKTRKELQEVLHATGNGLDTMEILYMWDFMHPEETKDEAIPNINTVHGQVGDTTVEVVLDEGQDGQVV